MKEIKLTQGYSAIVDDEDFERVNAIKWYAGKCGNKIYGKSDLGTKPNRIRLYMHRFILNVTDNKVKIDHIDGNTLNNQKHNIRYSSQSENIRHRSGMRKGNTSGFRGVSKDSRPGQSNNPWIAKISINSKTKYIGSFKTAEEAAKAFDKAAKETYGEFCGKLNYE